MNSEFEWDPEKAEGYDLSGGVRGKYVERLKDQVVVLLEPDVRGSLSRSESVDKILRGLVPIIHAHAEKGPS